MLYQAHFLDELAHCEPIIFLESTLSVTEKLRDVFKTEINHFLGIFQAYSGNFFFLFYMYIFYGIWITQSGAMVLILNLDKVSLKKLFPTMNI